MWKFVKKTAGQISLTMAAVIQESKEEQRATSEEQPSFDDNVGEEHEGSEEYKRNSIERNRRLNIQFPNTVISTVQKFTNTITNKKTSFDPTVGQLQQALQHAEHAVLALQLILENQCFYVGNLHEGVAREIADNEEKKCSLAMFQAVQKTADHIVNYDMSVPLFSWTERIKKLCDLRHEVLRYYDDVCDEENSFSLQPLAKLFYFQQELTYLMTYSAHLENLIKREPEQVDPFFLQKQAEFNQFIDAIDQLSAITVMFCSIILTLKNYMKVNEDVVFEWENRAADLSVKNQVKRLSLKFPALIEMTVTDVAAARIQVEEKLAVEKQENERLLNEAKISLSDIVGQENNDEAVMQDKQQLQQAIAQLTKKLESITESLEELADSNHKCNCLPQKNNQPSSNANSVRK